MRIPDAIVVVSDPTKFGRGAGSILVRGEQSNEHLQTLRTRREIEIFRLTQIVIGRNQVNLHMGSPILIHLCRLPVHPLPCRWTPQLANDACPNGEDEPEPSPQRQERCMLPSPDTFRTQ